jgi:hypothetical protein
LAALSVISHLLGEAAASDENADEEWMYAVGDGATKGDAGAARIQKRLASVDAAAIRDARALLRAAGPLPTTTTTGQKPTAASANVSNAAFLESWTETLDEENNTARTGRSHSGATARSSKAGASTRGAASRVSLADSNHAFMLIGDLGKLRDRGAVPSAAALTVAAGPAGVAGAVGSIAAPTSGGAAAGSAAAALGGCGPLNRSDASGGGLEGGSIAHATVSAAAAAPLTVAIDAKISDVDAILQRWEALGADPFAAWVRHVFFAVVSGQKYSS